MILKHIKNAEAKDENKLALKANTIYDCIRDRFFISSPREEDTIDGRDPTLLISLLTAIINGKQLTAGNFGRGKTTSAEAIIALVHGIPCDATMACEARGDPEITKEEYIAIPDLTNMNNLLWRRFAQMPPKVFDEFNRMPSAKQSLFLDGIDRGNFEYMNQTLRAEPGPFYATMNWPDRGNVEILPPMLDRFDVSVITSAINPMYHKVMEEVDRSVLEDGVIAAKMLAILDANGESYQKKIAELTELADAFRASISMQLGIGEGFTSKELATAREEIKNIEYADTGDNFKLFIRSETICPTHGEYMPGKACGGDCHWGSGNANEESRVGFAAITSPISERFFKSLSAYAKALAWYLNEKEVSKDHVRLVLPYVLWHRVQFAGDFMAGENKYRVGKQLENAKDFTKKIFNRFTEQEERINELGEALREPEDKNRKEHLAKARAFFAKIQKYANEYDHPIFAHALQMLGKQGSANESTDK